MLGRTTKRARAAAILGAAMTCAGLAFGGSSIVSCGGSSEAAAGDAGAAGDSAVATEDATADAATEAEASASCNLGATPAMPALTSKVVIEGGDGGAPPTATGGDEIGTWVYTKITLYLPPQASGQIDPAGSKIEGKGFIEMGSGTFRQLVDTTTVLSTSIVGTVTRAGSTKALGTYVKNAAALTFTPTCRESTGEGGSLDDVAFTRVDATHAQLRLKTSSQIGTANLVIDLEKAP